MFSKEYNVSMLHWMRFLHCYGGQLASHVAASFCHFIHDRSVGLPKSNIVLMALLVKQLSSFALSVCQTTLLGHVLNMDHGKIHSS